MDLKGYNMATLIGAVKCPAYVEGNYTRFVIQTTTVCNGQKHSVDHEICGFGEALNRELAKLTKEQKVWVMGPISSAKRVIIKNFFALPNNHGGENKANIRGIIKSVYKDVEADCIKFTITTRETLTRKTDGRQRANTDLPYRDNNVTDRIEVTDHDVIVRAPLVKEVSGLDVNDSLFIEGAILSGGAIEANKLNSYSAGKINACAPEKRMACGR
jgi:hypothetical protein